MQDAGLRTLAIAGAFTPLVHVPHELKRLRDDPAVAARLVAENGWARYPSDVDRLLRLAYVSPAAGTAPTVGGCLVTMCCCCLLSLRTGTRSRHHRMGVSS